MWIIDRYLLRHFIGSFLICYCSLSGLYIVFDAFTNLDGFLRAAEKTGSLFQLFLSFYGYQCIMFFERLSGLLTLMASMFTVAWLQRHNEMTALQAAGLRRLRIVRPLIVAGVTIACVSATGRELVIPRFREQLSRKSQDLIGDVAQPLKPVYDNQTGILLRGAGTLRDGQRIVEPSFVLPSYLDHYGKQLTADEARYQSAQGDRPNGYLLVNIREPKGLDRRPSLSLRGVPVVLTRHDHPWLEPNQCFVVSDMTFDQLAGGQGFKQFASTAELIAGLRNPSMDYGADVRVAVHARVVQPILDVLLLLMGLPLVATRYDRNVFLAIGQGMALVTVFSTVVIAMQYLGNVCLVAPATAAWLPLFVFVPAAVAMFESLRD